MKGLRTLAHLGPVSMRSTLSLLAFPEADARPVSTLPSVAELFRTHAALVERWAQRLGGPCADVADIVQDVFLAAHRHRARFRGACSVTTWLYRITANEVRQRRRRARVRAWFGSRVAVGEEEVQGPAELVEQRRETAFVYAVLDRMKEKHRTALILFELEGWTGEEIAERMGARVQTVWVWLHRARAEFAAMARERRRW